jgi:CheY-like chemotaxis protein
VCHHPLVARTVLVVDDHPSFRRFARQLLEASGYAVVDEAGDGREALEAVRTHRPDVVLLDVLLPDTTGFELAEDLCRGRSGPVIVLTSSRSAADFEDSIERSPARGFIAKRDFTPLALKEVLEGTT